MAATASEKYQAEISLPFTPAELGAFHRFHAYNWDEDEQFQAGLKTITQTQLTSPSFSELLKMKQYYFSTRLDIRINLDDYLAWRKHLEKPSDDPNVPIFKRFDEYNFDTDVNFQKGLPSFIGQLIKNGKSSMDKAALQKEMTKAKAFYYARFIELFDFPAYLTWKEMEKSQAAPACPYAHLWQDKGKGSGNELAEDSQKFLSSTYPVSTGALQLHVHSPATRNKLTGVRLAKISQEISVASIKDNITSVIWTVNSGKSSRNERDPESEIVTKDEKWFSGGVVTSGSTAPVSEQDAAKSKDLFRQYYSLVDQVSKVTSELEKPVVMLLDGIVSLSAAYLAFGTGAQRVITENATLSFTPTASQESTPNQVENSFAGLYLLAQIQAQTKSDTSGRPLPKGVGHYLAFCPDYILRGPDLRKLGLADFFISSSKKGDVEDAVLSVAGCPPPHTTQAIRMALNAEVVYPGPAKIDVWRSEIQECFGEATSVENIVSNLEKYDNNWSKSIRTYIASLEPIFAKLLFKAINEAAELSTFQECARLEYRLAQKYKDYVLSATEEQKKSEASNDLESFFKPSNAEEEEQLFNFSFADWLQEHGEEEEFNNVDSTANGTEEQDPQKACPFLAGKASQGSDETVPSDHPKIPGVDFTDSEAAKACPFLAGKASQGSDESVPSDHPKIPGVDFSDPEAAKACPVLSAKSNQNTTAQVQTAPSDHPKIPGVDFSNPEAFKACPFLSAKESKESKSEPAPNGSSAVPADHPVIPGVDFSKTGSADACPFLSAKKAAENAP
ncbi:hypothetical protein BGZ50_007257 [Haplosporangium sp. Z 11]|nr:hypothetical protein BGZ50_007257 [Haplosporangium sp. Z 11]